MQFKKFGSIGAVMAVALVGCGDDDAGSDAYADFCQAELQVEAAVAAEDPAAIEPAFEALVAAAPEASSEVVELTVSEAQKCSSSPVVSRPRSSTPPTAR